MEGISSSVRVSVILTVLNEGEGMATLLDALLSQSRLPDEIVVVDGGSRDGTLAALVEYARLYGRIRYFVEPGVNIAEGRNIAIARAIGGIIAVTDGGSRPEPQWLENLMSPLLADETIGAVAGAFVVEWRTRFEFYSGMLCQPSDQEREETRLFYGRSSAFRRNLWEAVGGYPEWLYTAEDTLFALRARQLGFRVAHAPGGTVHWRPRPTLRKLAKMFFLYGRGNGRIDQGSMKGSLYWLRYHGLLLVSLAAGVGFPVAWLISLAVAGHLYRIMSLPVLREVRRMIPDRDREFYVPIIVFTRNLSTNLGYLFGRWDCRCNPAFRENLAAYSGSAPSRSVTRE
jgi:glycosyltransferase involved in cell wall biosynthesis